MKPPIPSFIAHYPNPAIKKYILIGVLAIVVLSVVIFFIVKNKRKDENPTT